MVQAHPSTSTQVAQKTIYVKNEPQILSAIQSIVDGFIVANLESLTELVVSDMECDNTEMDDTHEDINLLTNPNVTLLSTPSGSAGELKLEGIVSG